MPEDRIKITYKSIEPQSIPVVQIHYGQVFKGTLAGDNSIWLACPGGIFNLRSSQPFASLWFTFDELGNANSIDPSNENIIVEDYQPLKSELVIYV